MSVSIFERCGGFAAVRKVVSAFYDNVLESPNLARYFEDSDMESLIDHQTQFIAYVMGGPASVSDEILRRSHARLGISKSDFEEIVEILAEALEDQGIESDDVSHVENEIRKREHLIVTRRDENE